MQLIHGDCLQEMKKIPDHSVDMIFCDLPYGTTMCTWDILIPFDLLWVQYRRVIKKDRCIALFGSQPFTSLLVMSNIKWFSYEWIWKKSRANGFLDANRRPMKSHESITIFLSGKRIYNPQGIVLKNKSNRNSGIENVYGGVKNEFCQGKTYTNYPSSVLEFSNVHNPTHPTQKPTALLEYLIKTYTNEGDLVLDNCMGSGSTGIACLNTNRDFIGIELYPLPDKPISKTNPDYFGIAQRRIAKWKFEPADDPTSEKINLF